MAQVSFQAACPDKYIYINKSAVHKHHNSNTRCGFSHVFPMSLATTGQNVMKQFICPTKMFSCLLQTKSHQVVVTNLPSLGTASPEILHVHQ